MTTHDVPPVRLVDLSHEALKALLADDLAEGSRLTGIELTPELISERNKRTWKYRVDLLAVDPAAEAWALPQVALNADGEIVGRGGFHGPPDERGMVEVGYSVDPGHRRKGYATALLAAMLKRAAEAPDALVVRASVSPDNVASLATIAKFGFVHVGELMDDEDGLELLYERPAQDAS
ncbi:GNAT family protein [Phytomonospora sp. NPDC050363]|uniref:GNAT family N-acetyltransferase n=1 Tax=Phytomonospora sp. NPDC050363 TaxID=3155642 RepID=UPI0033D8D92B